MRRNLPETGEQKLQRFQRNLFKNDTKSMQQLENKLNNDRGWVFTP